MRTFAPKKKPNSHTPSFSLKGPGTGLFSQNHWTRPLTYLQRATENQVLDHLAQPDTEEPQNRSVSAASSSFGFDFSKIPVHAEGPRHRILPKLMISTPGDAQDSLVPDAVSEVLSSSGQPLAAAQRRFFEPRFSQDFGDVRVHDDAQANASARAIDAQAYTFGHHMVFGPQADELGSEHGRRLIAHELVHVVQHSNHHPAGALPARRISQPGDAAEAEADAVSSQALRGATPSFGHTSVGATLSRQPRGAQPPTPAVPFYQEALDALAAERRQIITFIRSEMIPHSVPAMERLVALCEAIDRGAVGHIKTALAAFLAVNPHDFPPLSPSASLVAEMSARMIMLGLEGESAKLRRWSVARENISPSISGPFSQDIYAWERIAERLLDRIPETGGAEGLKALDGLLVFFGQLVRERLSLNEKEINEGVKERAKPFNTSFVPPHHTISVYASELVRLRRETFAGIQSAFQLVLDQAVADLTAGRGDAMLTSAKDRLENRLLPLVELADKSRYIGDVSIETTKSGFKKGGGVHYDVLAKTEAARARRSVKIHFYDVKQMPSVASEMSSDFAGVFRARRRQIALIEKIYGLQKDDQGKLTAETKENAAAMAKLGPDGLRLHNDDDWRKFVVAKFELRVATDSAENALKSVILLIQHYMRVFTTHTPYNIDDFGDNLLTKTFPRDRAGRLIHDCGVYALRTAYILSLLRDHPRLKLRFHYVIMPLHVGLLITGDDLPMFLVNNDAITPCKASDLAALRSEWKQLDEEGKKGRPAKPATETRFTGELMASDFISGVDLPYKQVDVVKTSRSAAIAKAQLWQQYTRDIAPAVDRLFGPSVKDPKSPNYQFYLQYLKLLDLVKQHYNNSLLPFWNVKAAGLWDKHKAGIKSAFDALQRATHAQKPAVQATYDAAVKAYNDALTQAFSVVHTAKKPIVDLQGAMQGHIVLHPEVFASRAEVARAERVGAMWQALGVMDTWWEENIEQHKRDLVTRTKIEAPFEKPEDKLLPLN